MIIDRIYEWARTTPQRPALVWNGQAVSYLRFARGIGDVRRILHAHNVPAGRTAVVAIHSLLDCWTVVLALRSLGMNTVAVLNLDSAVALGLDDVAYVVTDPRKSEGVAKYLAVCPGAVHVQVPQSFYQQIAEGPVSDIEPDRPPLGGHLLYTSGTTGRYKMLMQSADGELARCALRAQSYGMRPEAPWFVGNLCLWTAVGYKMPLAAWSQGGHVVWDQREDWPDHFVKRPCSTLLVPDMVMQLLAQAKAQTPQTVGQWPLWVTAGFISAAQAQQIKAHLTTALAVSYGSSELSSPALQGDVGDVQDMHWLRVAPQRCVEIVDELGQASPVGQEGQLRVRLRELDATAYFQDAVTSSQVFQGGYFYPGDMAVAREDGRIRVLGRSADVLNLKGRKLAVAPVEQAIQDLLGVSAVCIFSGLDAQGFEEIWVVCESEHEPNPTQLAALKGHLKAFDRVRCVTRPVFPRTTNGTGKIQRVALRQDIFGPTAND